MTPIKVNINQQCIVRELPAGAAAFDAYYHDLGLDPERYRAICRQPDGRLKLQLWEQCRYYGAAMHIGSDPPFETAIEILMEE